MVDWHRPFWDLGPQKGQGSQCIVVETPTTFTNELDLKAINSLLVGVCYYVSKFLFF